MLAYGVLLEDPEPRPLIGIEEPENGLYIELIERLAVSFVAHTARPNAPTQIFVTTHSPYFVDALQPDQVWLMEKRHGRSTAVLDLLPATLRAYAESCDDDEAVLVLVDADDDNCKQLLQKLRDLASAMCPKLRVVFRIAIEETEAFYLGDLRAIKAAFPDADIERARRLKPDSLPEKGTAETFAEIVGDDALRKVEWAELMGPRLTTRPEQSRSHSFRKLHAGIQRLVTATSAPRRRRPKHWKARYSSERKRPTRR